jgi:hypothetical protein
MDPGMHRLAPALLALALTACSVVDSIESHLGLDDGSGSCGDGCKATEKNFGLEDRTVHDYKEKTFTSGGTQYTLVRVEYGKTEDCDPLGDCSYSTYCGFRVGDKDYPLEVSWVTDEDRLFDPAEYCEGGELEGCELPGQALPILDDPDFEDWIYDTDPDEDVLADCFADYW